MGTVTIHEVRYLEDECALLDEHGNVEGYEIPYDDAHTTTTVYDELTAREAADRIRREGLTFAATGNDWAANPDGSYISNYGTGERCETTAHLSGFHPRVVDAIMQAVDA
jgi:hypothetical protein